MRLRQGEVVELSVAGIGGAGDGVAQWQGVPVFLPFTVPGDHMRARLGARRGSGFEGRVIELTHSGHGRAPAPCSHFGQCGGCALQHLDLDLYRSVKLGRLLNALKRAGVEPGEVEPLQTVPPMRRRARFGLARPRDPPQPVRVGCHERFRHELVDLRECLVLEPALFELAGELRRLGPDRCRRAGRLR
jgi:23S rRNA (uracil1939-C5)-methyltransferase